MIPASPRFSQIPIPVTAASGRRWQQVWRDAVTDPKELLALLGLSHRADELLATADTGFALRVPRGFIARMRHGDAADPLLLQVLPGPGELLNPAGYATDAVGDLDSRAASGVLQKYAGRSLLIATGSCAINCRYCFRRHFPYAEETAAAGRWRAALEHLAGESSINEVILSGGDPLSLSTPRLAELTDALQRIPHIRRLRVHSRLPIVLPERVDRELLDWLDALPMQKVMVVHANHANEIDEAVIAASEALRGVGLTLLNQSVLLRRINDTVQALCDLSERLIAAGILPYYLHQLDRVQGTSHFEVEDANAVELVDSMRCQLPGYLVPKLVREVAGDASKRPL
ncbi:EF-P beta-lysylation protein EpmB [Dokdonella sp.]|uniref:EF-P beta-lysylation protein EpmB n=1 Tax=Dokdonella sp. TaxID=2291710 RepID=UPI0035273C56